MGESIPREKEGGPYGWELILDLHHCDIQNLTRDDLEKFFVTLCDDVLDMERCDLHFWDDEGMPEEDKQTDPNLRGISAIQFIITSNVTIHTLPDLNAVYLNIFSCKDFDATRAMDYCAGFFKGDVSRKQLVARG